MHHMVFYIIYIMVNIKLFRMVPYLLEVFPELKKHSRLLNIGVKKHNFNCQFLHLQIGVLKTKLSQPRPLLSQQWSRWLWLADLSYRACTCPENLQTDRKFVENKETFSPGCKNAEEKRQTGSDAPTGKTLGGRWARRADDHTDCMHVSAKNRNLRNPVKN